MESLNEQGEMRNQYGHTELGQSIRETKSSHYNDDISLSWSFLHTDEQILVVFNFSVLEPLNVNILMCQSPDESILKNVNFLAMERLFLIDLIFQGLDESILENSNFFA